MGKMKNAIGKIKTFFNKKDYDKKDSNNYTITWNDVYSGYNSVATNNTGNTPDSIISSTIGPITITNGTSWFNTGYNDNTIDEKKYLELKKNNNIKRIFSEEEVDSMDEDIILKHIKDKKSYVKIYCNETENSDEITTKFLNFKSYVQVEKRDFYIKYKILF